MSKDEISVMDGSKCILQLRGVRPFFSSKYDITKHKRFKELSDFDPRNAFDIEQFVHPKMQLKMNDVVETFEVDLTELSMRT